MQRSGDLASYLAAACFGTSPRSSRSPGGPAAVVGRAAYRRGRPFKYILCRRQSDGLAVLLAMMIAAGSALAGCAHGTAETPRSQVAQAPEETARERVLPRVISLSEADRLLPLGAGPRRALQIPGLIVLYVLRGTEGAPDELITTAVAARLGLDGASLDALAVANLVRLEPPSRYEALLERAVAGRLMVYHPRRFNEAATSLLVLPSAMQPARRLSALLVDADTVAVARRDVDWQRAKHQIRFRARTGPHGEFVAPAPVSEAIAICAGALPCGEP